MWKALFEMARRHDADGGMGLTSLDLSSNNIGDDGLRILAAVAREIIAAEAAVAELRAARRAHVVDARARRDGARARRRRRLHRR